GGEPLAGLHVRFGEVDYGDEAAVLEGEGAGGTAETAAHVEHARAGRELREARETIRGGLAAAVELIHGSEVVDGQRVEVLAGACQRGVEGALEIAASPVGVGRLRVARRRRHVLSKSVRSETGRPRRYRRRQSSPSSTAPRRTHSRPPRMRLCREATSASPAIASAMVPPRSMRSAPSSRSIRTASTCVAPVWRRAACATTSAISRLTPSDGGAPVSPTAAHTSPRSRAATARRNTPSAPGRCAKRAAICPLVKVSTRDSEPLRAVSSASTTPSSV